VLMMEGVGETWVIKEVAENDGKGRCNLLGGW
jgi:hypothetical protein